VAAIRRVFANAETDSDRILVDAWVQANIERHLGVTRDPRGTWVPVVEGPDLTIEEEQDTLTHASPNTLTHSWVSIGGYG
jgi:hypothetical protein